MTSSREDDLELLLQVIRQSWSPETTDDWHPDDPGRHQCGVSALVIQDYFGGGIVRNKIAGRTVWFCRLDDGTEVFHSPEYEGQPRGFAEDQPQTRDQVMGHPDMPRRYDTLSWCVIEAILRPLELPGGGW